MARIVARVHAGQAALEFALVSLFLMAIFFGILDLGRGVFQRQDLANAAREGARFAMVSSDARAHSATSFATAVAAAANLRSPPLNLTATNFSTAGVGGITCETWGSALITAPTAREYTPLPLFGSGLLALSGMTIMTKPPAAGGSTTPVGGWGTIACAQATPGDRITVCVGYSFRPATTRLLGIGPIPMKDCASVTVQ